MPSPLHARFLLLAVAACGAPTAAQTVVHEVLGTAPVERLGHGVAGVGDIDLDGVPDFAVGAYLADDNGVDAGRVTIHSGATGAVLHTFAGDAAGDWLGYSMAGVGDVDGDGWRDLAVGAPRSDVGGTDAGQVQVLSGRDGTLLHAFTGTEFDRLGSAVAAAGDVDGDGRADVALSAPLAVPGEVRVHSGADGRRLLTVLAPGGHNGSWGRALHGGLDVSGDGVPDLAIGDPLHSDGLWERGRYVVVSGADGSTLFGQSGAVLDERLGVAVRLVDDLDGDGRADVVVSAVGTEGSSVGSSVRVYSGATGALLLSSSGAPDTGFGQTVGSAGDANGDGVGDLVVGEPWGDGLAPRSGNAWIVSGADGARLGVLRGAASEDRFGLAVDGVGDLVGDGLREVIVGAPNVDAGAPDGGQALVVDLFVDCNGNGVHDWTDVAAGTSGDADGDAVPDECEFESYCDAAANSTGAAAQMTWTGSNSVGANDLELLALQLPAVVNGLFVYAAGPASVPLGNGILCLDPTIQGFVNRLPFETSNGSGTMTHALDLTAPPAPASLITPGSTWYFSCWFRDPPAGGAGFNFANGLAVTFQP